MAFRFHYLNTFLLLFLLSCGKDVNLGESLENKEHSDFSKVKEVRWIFEKVECFNSNGVLINVFQYSDEHYYRITFTENVLSTVYIPGPSAPQCIMKVEESIREKKEHSLKFSKKEVFYSEECEGGGNATSYKSYSVNFNVKENHLVLIYEEDDFFCDNLKGIRYFKK